MVLPESLTKRGLIMRLVHVLLAAIALVLIEGASALAHPHVYVTVKSELVYAPDGSLTGVRHAWTFDEMFSTFATQGIETKKKGEFTREELKPLAEVNVTSLKEYGYFTYLKASGKKIPLVDPVDYYLEFKDAALTLHFMLPLKDTLKTAGYEVEIFDPDYFVDFSFVEKDPVALVSAPQQCKLTVARPGDAAPLPQAKLGESFFQQPDTNYGAQFANRISVKCP
jgi:ABC-type uncharacterized transport system substrate-binding protein